MTVTDSSAHAASTGAGNRTLRWYDAPGHLMCCLCFEQVAIADVYVCEHGQKWDMCAKDGSREGCLC